MSSNKRSELREAVEGVRPFFVRAGTFSITGGLLALAPSAYMLEVYDRVVNSRSYTTLVMITLMIILAYAVMEVVEWARGQLMHQAGAAFEARMAPRVFDLMFRLNLQRPGQPNPQPLTDLRTIRDGLAGPVIPAAMESPVALVYAVLLFAISPWLGVAGVVGAVLQVLIGWLNERSTQPPLVAAQKEAMAAQQHADGSLRNAEVIESMGMLRDVQRHWLAKQERFLSLQAQASVRAGRYASLTRLLQNLMGSMLLGLAAWLLLGNELHGGGSMLIIGSILGGRMLAPLVQVITQWRAVILARDAWSRLSGLLEAVPERPTSMPLPAPRGRLTVEQVIATAPGTQAPILRGVSFGAQPGQAVAVVGPSASGKSTLARLLVGIWPAGTGKVRLDGADVYEWDKAELGPHIGYLPQDVELFEGSIAENIARFGEVDPVKVEAAAAVVGLHEFILELPQGYDTPVGHDGARLSGGQRQRIALARALYGRPALVVLDEPNSSLDEAGDAALAAAIVNLKATGTTFVVMTHRTSVLSTADLMLVLMEGAVQAFGPRDEVVAALAKAAAARTAQPAARALPPGAAQAVPN